MRPNKAASPLPWAGLLILLALMPLSGVFAETPPAFEAPGVAERLGVRSAAVASAVESGVGRAPFAPDEVTRKMDLEASRFLQRSRPPEELGDLRLPAEPYRPLTVKERREREKVQAERERREAVEWLEFRRNVEEAMQKILSFQPTMERRRRDWRDAETDYPESYAAEAAGEYPDMSVPVPGDSAETARQRLFAGIREESYYATPTYRRARPQREEALNLPAIEEPRLKEKLEFNRAVRGSAPSADYLSAEHHQAPYLSDEPERRRPIRVFNDDSASVRRNAGGVIKVAR